MAVISVTKDKKHSLNCAFSFICNMYLKGMESSDTAQAVMCLRGIGRDEKVSKVSPQ